MKKFIILTLFAFSFLAAHTNSVIMPIPSCNPCDWVR
jgi:hypothetical protein